MKTQQKIRIDRLVGRPVAFAFNLAARALGRLLRRDHAIEPERVRTIVVAKFVGMGSVLQATPLLRALRRRFPQARLVLLTSPALRPLMAQIPHVDGVIYVDDRSLARLARSALAAVRELWRRDVDLYFDLEVYSAFGALIGLLSLAHNRFGFYRESARFKLGIYTHLLYFNAHQPVRRIYLQLGAAAGASTSGDGDDLGPVVVADESRESFRGRWTELAGETAGEAPIVINPNASDLLIERRWPRAHFVEVIEALTAAGRLVALTGAPDESIFVAELTAALSPEAQARTVDTSGRLSFSELCALLESARCVITNDTGPMHLAIALGRPTVCLFGPGDPAHYGTERPDVSILYEGVFCSPCLYHTDQPPCAGDNVCMQRIQPSAVVREAERLCAIEPATRSEVDPALASGAPAGTGVSVARNGSRSTDGPDAGRDPSQPLGTVVRESVLGTRLDPCEVCGDRRFRYRFHREAQRFIACSACGLERIDPPPTDRQLAAIYGHDYYNAWGLHEGSDVAASVATMKKGTFEGHISSLSRKLPAEARILDCGAATGFFMEVAAECGLVPYGVELSEFGAKEIARRFGADRVFCGDVRDAAFPAVEGFSAIFMLDFLEHVRDPRGVLERSFELLAPGGSLLITTPDTGSLTHRGMGARWTHYKVEHLHYFSRRNLASLLEQVGFRVVRRRAARKVLTLRYFYHQFSTYRHWLITPIVSGAYRLLPDRARDARFRVPIGEMLLEARKEA